MILTPIRATSRPASTGSTSDDSTATLFRIAESAIRLAALGPHLAALAAQVKAQAQDQARVAVTVAETTGRLAKDLAHAVETLRTSAHHVGEAVTTVDRIADQTRMLAINASIEAARAGVHGKPFGVIVNEVQNLSQRTTDTTHLIEERVNGMRADISRVAKVASTSDSVAADSPTVGAVNRQAQSMADSARHQLSEAESIYRAGSDLNALTEALLLSVGAFRFRVHERAASDLAVLIPDLITHQSDRRRLELALADWIGRHDYFEVAYLTDADGRQIVDNVVRSENGSVRRDHAGFGCDWSDRPWFDEATRHAGIRATNIYRSKATGGYCFTVSGAMHDVDGTLIGVVGADVNFEKVLQS